MRPPTPATARIPVPSSDNAFLPARTDNSPPTRQPKDLIVTGLSEIHAAITGATPTLRALTALTGFLAIILCPMAYCAAAGGMVICIIAIVPLMISAGLVLFLHLERKTRSIALTDASEHTQSVLHTTLTAVVDALLVAFHIVCFVLLNVSIHKPHQSYDHWYLQRIGALILGAWVSMLVLVDIVVHILLFVNALPIVFGLDGQHVCARCGFHEGWSDEFVGARVGDMAVADTIEVAKAGKAGAGMGKGIAGLVGRFRDEYDEEEGTSQRSGEGWVQAED